MADRRRPHSSLHARARRAAASGRVIPYLAASIAVLAIVTLGTVGYGDVVPHSAWGRVLGSIVIVFGVTFVSLLFATVTSFLVGSDQEEEAATAQAQRIAVEEATRALLQEIASRLTAIEAELAGLKRSGG